MAAERNDSDPREVRLEGARLVVLGGFLLALIAGAFFLGRWIERRSQPSTPLMVGAPGPLDQVVETEPPARAEDDLTYFDEPRGREQELEPSRELPLRQVRDRPAEPSAAEPDPAEEQGSFFVQVFAGRDRRSAERYVDELQKQSYGVRLFTEREGTGSLFKVRVGGYRTQDRARAVALELQRAGYQGAWVVATE